eukprot:TRINITY_DN2665_c0_g3_i2.p1 TRINITY_DN2665_c0_g3~~TRINITY_DN2665_c0_g3_i2.p1  ORF type:complete len:3735 (+),score=895.51 TRINITY_DN2665_c0_g3_i2:675-11207(+)
MARKTNLIITSDATVGNLFDPIMVQSSVGWLVICFRKVVSGSADCWCSTAKTGVIQRAAENLVGASVSNSMLSCVPVADGSSNDFWLFYSYIGADGFSDRGILVRKYSLNYAVQVAETIAHSATSAGDETNPAGVGLNDGKVVMVFNKVVGGVSTVQAQLMSSAAAVLSAAQVSTAGAVSGPAEIALLDGLSNFVVIWKDIATNRMMFRRMNQDMTYVTDPTVVFTDAVNIGAVIARRASAFVVAGSKSNGVTLIRPYSQDNEGGDVISITGAHIPTLYLEDDFLCVLYRTTAAGYAVGASSVVLHETTTFTVTVPTSLTSGAKSMSVNAYGYRQTTFASAYTLRPLGTISSVTPSDFPAAGGSRVTIADSSQIGTGSDITSVTIKGVTVSSIVGQTTSSVTVTTAAATSGSGSVTVYSTQWGNPVYSSVTYNPVGTLTSITPTSCPIAGGRTVTILASSQISSGSDITSVRLKTIASTISAQTTSSVTVVCGAATAGPGAVLVQSTARGSASSALTFTYNPVGAITTVTPNQGPVAGGYTVTITASSNIGSGSDITLVTLKGFTATSIVAQTATSVTITVAAASSSGSGNVVVSSYTYGTATLVNGFTYNPVGSVNSIVPNLGPAAGGFTVTLRATASQIGSGSDITSVTLCGTAVTSLGAQTTSSITVVAAARTAITGAVVLSSTSFGTVSMSSAFTYTAVGTITGATPNSGPIAGGSTVTITASTPIGSGSDITRVSLKSVDAATIVSQTTSTVTVTTQSTTAGTGSVTVYSVAYGTATLASAWTYNAPATITSVTPNNGPIAGGFTVTILASTPLSSGSGAVVSLNGVAVQSYVAQTGSSVTVVAAAGSAGSGTGTITSATHGTTTWSSFTYNPVATITSVTPSAGPVSGGRHVTILASSFMGSGTDITYVTLKSVAAASIVAQTTSSVTVVSAAGSAGVGPIQASSVSYGIATLGSAYTYNAAGTITNANPNIGPAAGGFTVTVLASSQIGSGSDITSVTLCGSAVTSITAQTTSTVTVVAAARVATVGAIVTESTAFGTASLASSFTYAAVGTIDSVVPSSAPAAGATRVTITASTAIGSGSDISVVNIAASIVSQTATSVIITTAAGAGLTDVHVTSTTRGTATKVSAFTFNAVGTITAATPNAGPEAGSTQVTITASSQIGSGADITQVKLGTITATIVSQTTTRVVVTAPASLAGAVAVTVVSTAFGTASLGAAYTYNPVGVIASLTPNAGPIAGGTRVTIIASQIGSGSDITFVSLKGVTVTNIVSQTTSSVTVTAAATTAGTGSAVVRSTAFGTATSNNAFTYMAPGTISSVIPVNGPIAGGFTVTILGSSQIGSGSDITSVTLCGTAATTIGAQTTSSVTVVAPASSPTTGPVVVGSVSRGLQTKSNAFTYNAAGSISSLSPNNGPLAGGNSVTILSGSSIGSGDDITQVTLAGQVATITGQTSASVTVVAASASVAGAGDVVLFSTSLGNASLVNGYIYNAAGQYNASIPELSGSTAALRASCAITLTALTAIGDGTDITAVSFNGIAASVGVQTDLFVDVYPPSGAAGSYSVTIQSFSIGTTVGSHVMQSGGAITAILPSSGPMAGGFEVTLQGTDLLDRTSEGDGVMFGPSYATVLTATTSLITVTAPVSSTAGSTPVTVLSCLGGVGGVPFTYNPVGTIVSVTPDNGQALGGNTVTIAASTALGSGSDVTLVSFCGVTVASVIAQTAMSVTVVMADGSALIGLCTVQVQSVSFGTSTLANAYRYNAVGVWGAVTPQQGASGVNLRPTCEPVTITGTDLGNGNDISSVSFNGAASLIASQTSSQVIVFAPTSSAGSSSIAVDSASRGRTESPAAAYTFLSTSISALSMSDGPIAGGLVITISTANTASPLQPTAVQFDGVSATILSSTSSSVVVVQPPHAVGSATITIASCYGDVSGQSFIYNPVGTVDVIAPVAGRYSGGFSVTITSTTTIGDGSDITAVVIDTIPAIIVAQTASTVTVIAGDSSSKPAGTNGTVAISSARWGVATSAHGFFTYRSAPVVSTVHPNLGTVAGGTRITITGVNLGDGTDVTAVSLADVVATIVSQTATSVTVLAGASVVQLGGVSVSSVSFGGGHLPNCFSYAQFGDITGLIPNNGPALGGNRVTILGGLGTGDDINRVTMNGEEVQIVSQSSGDVVVVMNVGAVGFVDVSVRSVVAGTFTKANAYFYNLAGAITGITPRVGPSSGYRITVTGTNLGAGDITSASTVTSPAVIVSQSSTTVVLDVKADGICAVTLRSTSFGPTTSQAPLLITFNPPGVVYSVTPTTSVIAGGVLITIAGSDLGNGTDVTSVTLAGLSANIVVQFPSLLIVRTAASGTARQGPIVVNSVTFGSTQPSGITFFYKPQLVMISSEPLVTERSSDVLVSLSLDSQPVSDVVVTFVNGPHLVSNVTSMTFTSVTWQQRQYFSLRALVDGIVTGNVAGDLMVRSSSASSLFDGLTAVPPVIFVDTDAAYIRILRGTFGATAELVLGGYFLIEGDSQSLDISLSSQPKAPVNITFSANEPRLQYAAWLLFTAANWNITQQLPIIAQLDHVANAQPLTWATMTVRVITQDPNYLNIGTSVNFLILDFDLSGSIQIVSSTVLRNTTEAGGQTAFFAVLTRHITTAATVSAAVSAPLEASVSPTTMTIQDSDYLVPQALVLTGLDDWICDGDTPYHVDVTMSISGVVSTASIRLFNADNDTAVLSMSASASSVNETGSSAVIMVSISSQPLSAVVVSCNSSLQSEVAIVGSSQASIEPLQWRQPALFTIRGVRDSVHDPNATAVIHCTSTSSDLVYHQRNASQVIRNEDIHWPNVSSVSPTVFALVGVPARMFGADFLPGVALFAHITRSVQLNMTFVSSGELAFSTPRTTFSGYTNLTVLNPDGGYTVFTDAFFTEDCPYPGQWGRGVDCKNCTVGAICPGGYRLWPLPGYWASSEFAGYVTQCLPGRCLGGREPVCALGYRGEVCAQCDSGFYDAGLQCLPCAEPYVQGFLLLAQFAFSLILLLIILLASDATLNNVQFIFSCARVLWIVSSDGGEGLPPVVGQVYGIFGLFAGDLTFVRPGCTGFTSFLQLFGVNVGIYLALCIPIALFFYVRYKRATIGLQTLEKEAQTEVVLAAYSNHSADAGKGIVAMLMFSYQVILVKCLQVFYCESIEGQLRLVVDSNELCFSAGHAISFIFALFIVPAVGIAIPVYILTLAARLRDNRSMRPFERSIASNAVEEVQSDVWWFPTMLSLGVDFPLALNAVFLVRNQLAQNLINVFWNLIACGYVTWRKPFREWYKNAGIILTMLVSFLTQVSSLLIMNGSYDIASYLSYVFLALLLLWMSGMIAVFVYYVVYLQWVLHQAPQTNYQHDDTHLYAAFGDSNKLQRQKSLKFVTDSAIDSQPTPVRRAMSWISGIDSDEASGINTPAVIEPMFEQQQLQQEHSGRSSARSKSSSAQLTKRSSAASMRMPLVPVASEVVESAAADGTVTGDDSVEAVLVVKPLSHRSTSS